MRFINHFHYILFILLMCIGCNDPEVEILHLQESDTMATKLARNQALNAALNRDYRQAYVGQLYRSFGVGYGYQAFDGYADYDAVRDVIINLDSLQYYEQEEMCSCMVDDHTPNAYQKIMTGEDSEKLLKALTANAGLSADLKFFQGEVKGSYASSELKSNYYSFCTIHTGMVLGSRHLDPLALAELCRRHPSILSPGLRYLISELHSAVKGPGINQTKADELGEMLYSIYGTHLLYHADLGGRLTFMSTFERASLDSKTSLSVSAKANLLDMLSYSTTKGEEQTLKQTSSKSKKRITAIGGDVNIITQMLYAADDESSTKSAVGDGVIEKWFKSVKLNFDDFLENNTELIEIKLYPLVDFITALGDTAVSEYLNILIGKQSEYEDGMFPRVYEKVNARIRTDLLWQASNTQIHTIRCEDEVIGELDYEQIDGKEYISFYPTIDGVLHHEGIARGYGSDSLYRIIWHDSAIHLMPLCPVAEIPYLYYENGNIDIVGDSSYREDCKVEPLSTFMWTTTTSAALKLGSWTLVQGAYASTGDQSFNSYATVAKDIPIGYTDITVEEMNSDILPWARHHYNQCPEMLKGKQWLLRDSPTSKSLSAYTISDNEKLKLQKVENAYFGFVLCRRSDDFRYP